MPKKNMRRCRMRTNRAVRRQRWRRRRRRDGASTRTQTRTSREIPGRRRKSGPESHLVRIRILRVKCRHPAGITQRGVKTKDFTVLVPLKNGRNFRGMGQLKMDDTKSHHDLLCCAPHRSSPSPDIQRTRNANKCQPKQSAIHLG